LPLYRLDGRAILFVHVPKAAGTSVDAWLRAHDPAPLLAHSRRPGGLRCPPQHLEAATLAAVVPPEAVDYAFAIVRDPFDRLASEFFYRMAERPERRHRVGLRRTTLAAASEAEAGTIFARWLDRALARRGRDPYHMSNHLRPQHEFTAYPGTRVFRLEDGLDTALGAVAREAGLPPPGRTFGENRSPRRGLAMAARSRGAIARLYAEDFRRFGYDPEN
jgi:hypothetical protein